MILIRTRGLTILHYALQGILAVGVFWCWLYALIFLIRGDAHLDFDRYVTYSLLLVGAFGMNLLRSAPGQANLLQLNVLSNHRLVLGQASLIVGTLLAYVFAVRDETMSRMFLFSFAPILYVYLFLSNKYLPPLLARFVFNGTRRHRTVLFGSSRNCVKLRDWLARKASYGLEPVGLITNEKAVEGLGEIPVLGTMKETERVLRETGAAQLLVVEMPYSLKRLSGLSDLCDKLGVRLLLVNDLEEKLSRTISYVRDEGFNFVSLRQEPLECPVNRIVKRAFDMALSLPVVFFVLPPVSLMVWFLQRRQSPGPLFFRQMRTGLRGSEFSIYKFRTMGVAVEDESKQATENDPRVFPAGRWLRKLSIDELPQFLNVLNGEMSIVGPRPHLLSHDVRFGEIARYYKVRSFIKPGVTGLAQVRGFRGEARRDEELIDRVESDLYYVENWSIVMDWLIIMKTAYQVMVPSARAY